MKAAPMIEDYNDEAMMWSDKQVALLEALGIWAEEAEYKLSKVQDYARFCIECDRMEMSPLDFEGYLQALKK